MTTKKFYDAATEQNAGGGLPITESTNLTGSEGQGNPPNIGMGTPVALGMGDTEILQTANGVLQTSGKPLQVADEAVSLETIPVSEPEAVGKERGTATPENEALVKKQFLSEDLATLQPMNLRRSAVAACIAYGAMKETLGIVYGVDKAAEWDDLAEEDRASWVNAAEFRLRNAGASRLHYIKQWATEEAENIDGIGSAVDKLFCAIVDSSKLLPILRS